MTAAVDTIFQEKKVIYINSKVNGKAVTLDMIKTTSLGMVSYKGDGKYDHSTLWLWEEIPDSDFNDLEVVWDEDDLWPPVGQGWWPVIVIHLVDDAGVAVKGKVLVICF